MANSAKKNKRKLRVLGLLSHCSRIDGKILYHGVDYARVINPLLYLDCEVSIRLDPFIPNPDIRDDCDKSFQTMREIMEYYDVVIYSYTVNPDWYVAIAFHAEKFGAKLICEIDDNIWEVPERSGVYDTYREGSQGREIIEAQVKNSKFVCTTKQKTAYAIAKHCAIPVSRIHKNPNYIDLTVYNASKIDRKDDGKIRICYFGTNTHYDDIAANPGLVEAMDDLIKKYDNLELFTIGFFLPELKNRWKKHYFSMVGDQDVYSWANNLWVKVMSMSDIAIAPLLVSNFTRCKSNIKYLECAAAKMPVVAQDIDQYRNIIVNGFNGFLASTKQQWFDYLNDLIVDADYRKRIGESGYQTIVDNHQIQDNYKKFQDYLLTVDKS